MAVRAKQGGALAFDSSSGVLVVGDDRGLRLIREGLQRRVFGSGPVHDLAFAPGGELWIAGDKGAFRLRQVGSSLQAADGSDAGGLLERVQVAPGQGAMPERFALCAGAYGVATAQGVLLSQNGNRWQRLKEGVPSGAVTALAIRAQAVGGSWLLSVSVDKALWQVVFHWGEAGRLVVDQAYRDRYVGVRTQLDAVDFVAFATGEGGVVLGEDRLAAPEPEEGRWRVQWLKLPPGVIAYRGLVTADELWLATSRGLLRRVRGAQIWQASPPEIGNVSLVALLAEGGRWFALSEGGLFEGRRESVRLQGVEGSPVALTAASGVRGKVLSHVRDEPAFDAVRRAALAYLDLGPASMRALREAVGRRGRWPSVDLRLAAGKDRGWGRDFDESFSYGALHQLEGQDRDSSQDYDVSLTLRWDLGDAVYHPESIDVSHEAREVIELRDQILDELTQLYYARRRALLELANLERSAPGAGSASEAERLRLRVDELAAGIDAWTGGWFRSQTHAYSGKVFLTPR